MSYHIPDGTTARSGLRPAVGSVAGRHELSSAPGCVVPGRGLDARGSEARRQPGADPAAAHVPENRFGTAPALDDRRLPAQCGDKYAVCPGCRNRMELKGAPHTMRCARCECTFRVGWEEWFIGVG